MNVTWQFDGDDTGGSVTAYYGRCRVTQYENGGIIATLPALPTEEETRTRHELIERHARTGKIWVDGEATAQAQPWALRRGEPEGVRQLRDGPSPCGDGGAVQRAGGGASALMAGTAAGQVQVREGVVISEKMKERAARLIADTNIIIAVFLGNMEDHPIEAINVADLGCRYVRFCFDGRGEWWEEVVIEEADPGCVSFNTHVTNRLRDMGHENAHSVTEW